MSAAIKDKERLERLSTVRAAEKGMKEELQEKIQIKQEEAAKRQGSKVFSQILSWSHSGMQNTWSRSSRKLGNSAYRSAQATRGCQ